VDTTGGGAAEITEALDERVAFVEEEVGNVI